VGPWQ